MAGDLINSPELYESTDIPEEKKDCLRTTPKNTPDKPLYVEIVPSEGDSVMKCEKGVINLIAGIPLVINPATINDICDASFFKDNGDRIFISYKNLVDRISVCSAKTMINLEYRIEGKGDIVC